MGIVRATRYYEQRVRMPFSQRIDLRFMEHLPLDVVRVCSDDRCTTQTPHTR